MEMIINSNELVKSPNGGTITDCLPEDIDKEQLSFIGSQAGILAKQIELEKTNLSNALTEINDIPEGTIVVERHWYGIDADSIRKSLANIHSDLAGYIKQCGDGIKSTNQNLINTLGIICFAIKGEVELFSLLDDTSNRVDKVDIREAEFEDIFLEWCQNNNIKDEDVQKLFESSFQRAYTLKSRLQDVRDSVEQANNRIDQLAKSVNERKEEINRELDGALQRIGESASISQNSISEKAKLCNADLESCYSGIVKELNLQIKSINELFSQHETSLIQKTSYAEKIYDDISSSLREKDKTIRKYARRVAIISSLSTAIILVGAYFIFM
ncbi:MAG: hypothetical protein MJY49_00035 [Bacteroidales bacterium]|nr:hypothetical protein [Bacteroidales bacterium]